MRSKTHPWTSVAPQNSSAPQHPSDGVARNQARMGSEQGDGKRGRRRQNARQDDWAGRRSQCCGARRGKLVLGPYGGNVAGHPDVCKPGRWLMAYCLDIPDPLYGPYRHTLW